MECINLHNMYNYFVEEFVEEFSDKEIATVFHDNDKVTKIYSVSKEEFLNAALDILNRARRDDRVSYKDIIEYLLWTINILCCSDDVVRFEW